MDFLTIVYFFYTFIAFYFLLLHLLIYFQNKKEIYLAPKPNEIKELTIIIPCYNESDSIGKNIESFLQSDYPGLKKIIVVDDNSKDNSYEIIKEYARKYSQVMALRTPKNTGRAAGPKNFGLKYAKTELIGFSDADSIPNKNAISNMIGFFNDQEVGAITSRVLVSNNMKNKLIKAQAMEYKIIAFTRKLLEFIEGIYVTNGPLSLYRKEALDEVGGFDMKNMTEDIELTWAVISKGWKVRMAMSAVVRSKVPESIKVWFRQRVRWNIGGIQTIIKYKWQVTKKGILGYFILPFFALSWVIGISGLFFLAYRLFKYISMRFLVARYSVAAEVAIIRLNSFNLNPSILFLFGLLLLVLGLAYTVTGLNYSKERGRIIGHPFQDIFIYSFFYLLMYPPLLIVSFFKYLRGYNTW